VDREELKATMPTRLEQILAHTLLEVNSRRSLADLPSLERRAALHTPRGFRARLKEVAATRAAVISEIKRASPSKGLIRQDFDPASLAAGFEAAGAACLSVLTDEEFFQGHLEYLQAASSSVRIPCLRKDFILDPFQILEARAYGADAILLIVAALSDDSLAALSEEARGLGLDVLCEVHNRAEVERAVDLGFDLIGVNTRDLHTFTMNPELPFELALSIPHNTIKVAESGIRSADDIARYRGAGYDAFLVGEALMRQPDPAAALATLLEREYSRDE